MRNFRLLFLTLTLLAPVISYAQQQVMFTQYMFNGLAINPAYAGSHETVSITALAREQWTGIDGAPSTQTLSVHSPLRMLNDRVSAGLLFLHDKIGVTEQTGVYASYAYRLPFLNGGQLSLGIQAGFNSYQADFSTLSESDPTFTMGDVNETHPNFGFGAYYSTTRFFMGFSVPQLVQSDFDKSNDDSDSKIIRHYFATAGYVFDLNQFFKLKPHILVKAVDGAPIQFDLNASILIHELIWVGISWRSFDSFDAILQLQLTNRLQLGYAYDFATTTDLSRVNGGSHEVMLNYRFSFNKTKIITPRYF